ncbi:MAG: hypothetical protein ACO1OO_00015 [Flavisolibacter sp.]
MKEIILYFTLLCVTGCSSVFKQHSLTADGIAGISEQLSLAQRNFNDTSKHEKVHGTYRGFNPATAIFNKLKSKLKDSKYLVYLFTWQNDLPTVAGNFRAIVFDKTGGKTYYCSGSGSKRNLHIRTIPSTQELIDEKVLSSYLSDNSDLLRSHQGKFSSAEIGEDYTIYDIDLQNSKVTIHNFASEAAILQTTGN